MTSMKLSLFLLLSLIVPVASGQTSHNMPTQDQQRLAEAAAEAALESRPPTVVQINPAPPDVFLGLTGTAWTAIGSIVGASSLLFLAIFNVVYLRKVYEQSEAAIKQADIAQRTLRASITPVLTVTDITPSFINPEQYADVVRIDMTVKNVGQGYAPVVWAWYQPVSNTFSVFNPEIVGRTKISKDAYVSSNLLITGESLGATFDAYDPDAHDCSKSFGEQAFKEGSRWLFVIEALDQAQGIHQLKMAMTINGYDAKTDVSMAHSLGELKSVAISAKRIWQKK